VDRRRKHLITLVVVCALALAAAGCGDDAEPVEVGDGATGDGGEVAPDDVVVSVEVVGAFTTAEMAFQTMPSVVVYGDGTQFTPGAQIAIYPGPALPAVQRAQLSDEEVTAIVDAARDAGLDRQGVDYGQPPVADAGDTVVTVTIDGETYEHRATALGLAEGLGGDLSGSALTDEQLENREALAGFVDQVTMLPDGAEAELYEPDRYRLWVRPASEVDTGPVDEDNIEPRTVEWSVDGVTLEASDCLPVEGDDADAVGALLADADSLTRFDDGTTSWAVVARPVLPHEPTCPDA
jgi:hypothetical protein